MWLIVKDELINDIEYEQCSRCDYLGTVECETCVIRDILFGIGHYQTVDAVPVVHGKWINQSRFDSKSLAKNNEIIVEEQCEKCKLWNMRLERFNRPKYCPHCGAYMDGDKE